ncbi:MAG: hypothetical protein SGBAC_013592, partial [Bacillariaceae sp.]
MNPRLMFASFLFLLYLTTYSISNAEDPLGNGDGRSKQPSSFLTNDVTITENRNLQVPPPSTNPTAAPIAAATGVATLIPDDSCADDPDWWFEYEYMVFWARETEQLRCDDDRVECCSEGNHGLAKDYCCKCADMIQECPAIEMDTTSFYSQMVTGVAFVSGILVALMMYRRRELRSTRQTMTARRQQQRENNEQGLAEEERMNARYELFASRFHFQEVLPDKSNITVDGLRQQSSSKLGGKDDLADEERKTEIADNDDDELVVERSRNVSDNNSRRLSGWRRPAVKDECCICLECYTVGETICAPIAERCIHVFHEG